MRRAKHLLTCVSILGILAACSPGPAAPESEPAGGSPRVEPVLDPDRPVILAFGDSLTNGHDVDRTESYPSQLQDRLDSLGYRYQVINQGNDGDTTSGGLARMHEALALEPEIVILEFGGNDGLLGTPIEVAQDNLAEMIERFREIDSTVVLAGLTLPRNYGPDYIRQFENMYVELADVYDVVLIPFFLEGLVDLEALDAGRAAPADFARYMQSDGTHPTAEGYTIVAETVFGAIEPYLHR